MTAALPFLNDVKLGKLVTDALEPKFIAMKDYICKLATSRFTVLTLIDAFKVHFPFVNAIPNFYNAAQNAISTAQQAASSAAHAVAAIPSKASFTVDFKDSIETSSDSIIIIHPNLQPRLQKHPPQNP